MEIVPALMNSAEGGKPQAHSVRKCGRPAGQGKRERRNDDERIIMPPKSELRQLFKQQKQERQKEKRVEHPLAKYDSQGRLLCALCNLVIKTTALWPVHLMSNAHKENVARLKAAQQQKKKRQVDREADEPVSKRTKLEGEEDDDMQEAASNRLPSDFFDEGATAEAAAAESTEVTAEEESNETSIEVPPEHGVAVEGEEEEEEASQDTQNVIPHGFFDNPEEEALARKEASREQFEKELQEDMAQFQELMADTGEQQPSTNAQQEDDEAAEADDNIWSERDEELLRQQAEFDSRVEKLKQLRKQGVRPSDAMDTTNETRIRVEYDPTESRIRANLKSGVRELLKKEAGKNVSSVFEDMDQDEEEEEDDDYDEFGWRTQQM